MTTAMRSLTFVAVACLSCGGSPAPSPPPAVLVQSNPKAEPGPAAPKPVPVVRARAWPSALTVDGAGAEWPPLAGESSPTVSIAVSATGVAVLAELDGAWRDGLWVGIGSVVPGVPPVGEMFHRSGAPYPFDCEHETTRMFEGEMRKGGPRPADDAARCRAFVAKYEADVRAHRDSFQRRLRITADGIEVLAPDGTRVEVPGAAFKASGGEGHVTVEAELPREALPRLSESPLSTMRLAVAPLAEPKALDEDARWELAQLPSPIRFEPFGALRDRAFALLMPPEGDAVARATFPPGLSYHPSDPSHVRSVRHAQGAPTSIIAKDEMLYRRLYVAGDLEVGLVDAYAQSIAVFVKGKLVRLQSLHGSFSVDYAQPARIRGVFERAGAVHVVVFRPWHSEPMTGSHPPNYQVLAIDPSGAIVAPMTSDADGTTFSDLIETTRELAQFPIDSAFAVDFTTPALDRLGLRGVERDPTTGAANGFESIWTWSAPRKRYVQAYRKTTLPAGFDRDPERSRPTGSRVK